MTLEEPRQPDLVPAVLRDVRETLRTRWVDSAIAAAAEHPVFFTAAWSAIRPNVGPSFLSAASAIRDLAATGVAEVATPPDHELWVARARLDEADLAEIATTIRAFHDTQAKVAITVHALARAARGRPAGGSGVEESPPKRGVPGWHPHVSLEAPEEAEAVLEEAMGRLNAPGPPDVLAALARWPGYLTRAWRESRRYVGKPAWAPLATRIRRGIQEAVRSLPHVISLQWTALRDRGLTEEERRDVGDLLSEYDAAMPGTLLLVSYLWLAAGSPRGSRDS